MRLQPAVVLHPVGQRVADQADVVALADLEISGWLSTRSGLGPPQYQGNQKQETAKDPRALGP